MRASVDVKADENVHLGSNILIELVRWLLASLVERMLDGGRWAFQRYIGLPGVRNRDSILAESMGGDERMGQR